MSEGAVSLRDAPDRPTGGALALLRAWASDLAADPAAAVVVIVAVATAAPIGWATQIVAAVGLVLVPGDALRRGLGYETERTALRIATTMALGSIALMAAGILMSGLGTLIGVDRPMTRGPLVAVVMVPGLVATLRLGRHTPFAWSLPAHSVRWGDLLRRSWPLLLPLAAALGAGRLNAGHGAAVAVIAAAFAVIALLGLVLRGLDRGAAPRGTALVIFCATLALLWSTSLRGQHLFGWDIQQEFQRVTETLQRGGWAPPPRSDPYGAMASITVLPATIVEVSGLGVETVLRWLFPCFGALLPVLVWETARRRAPAHVATVAAIALTTFQVALVRQLPAIGRQEMALFVFATAMALAVAVEIPLRRRRLLVGSLIASLGFVHYSTSYVACALVGLAWLAGHVVQGRHAADRVISLRLVLGVIVATVSWNLIATDSGTNIVDLRATLGEKGVELLPSSEDGLLAAWIKGTSAGPLSVEEYEQGVQRLREGRLRWIQPDPRAADERLEESGAPREPGLLFELRGGWGLLRSVVAQLSLLASVAAAVFMAIGLWRRRRAGLPITRVSDQLAALALAAIAVSAPLRLSGTLAAQYNPERIALQSGVVLAPVVALALARWISRSRLAVLAVLGVLVVGGLDSSGLGAVIVGGGRPAALSAKGDDAERFVIGDEDDAAVRWIAENVPGGSIVQADRYGGVALLRGTFEPGLAIVDHVAPQVLDRSAWVLATRSNVVERNGRGALGDGRVTVFEFPESYLDATKSIVFTTGVTHVYR